MVEKSDCLRSGPDAAKTQLWKAYPDYYRALEGARLWPLWEEIHHFTATPAPRSRALPHVWPYQQARRLVLASADMLTAQEAERRVLALENPGLEGRMRTTQSMYAGYQLLMPGEIAPSHRHSPAAFRFIMEGHGAYTAVNGERTLMNPGDFVVTPSWMWHDHGNETDIPMIWLDGLDWPFVNQLELWFFEPHPEFQCPATGAPNPVLNYTYESTRAALGDGPRDGTVGRLRRVQAPLHDPGRRGCPADHRRLPPAPAEGFRHRDVSADRRLHLLGRRRTRAHHGRRRDPGVGPQGRLRGTDLGGTPPLHRR